MRVLRAQCDECGVFEIDTAHEIIYVNFSAEPRAKVDCPKCGEIVTSPISQSTAALLESSGVKVISWSEEITEEQIEEFVLNIDTEILSLLEF